MDAICFELAILAQAPTCYGHRQSRWAGSTTPEVAKRWFVKHRLSEVREGNRRGRDDLLFRETLYMRVLTIGDLHEDHLLLVERSVFEKRFLHHRDR